MAEETATGAVAVELAAMGKPAVHLDVSEIVIPGELGVFTVLSGHTPLLSALGIGVLVARPVSGEPQYFAVHGGYIEVTDDRVLVLAQTAEESEEIDLARAEEAKERAERRLKSREEDVDDLRAELALFRAVARINAKQGKEV